LGRGRPTEGGRRRRGRDSLNKPCVMRVRINWISSWRDDLPLAAVCSFSPLFGGEGWDDGGGRQGWTRRNDPIAIQARSPRRGDSATSPRLAARPPHPIPLPPKRGERESRADMPNFFTPCCVGRPTTRVAPPGRMIHVGSVAERRRLAAVPKVRLGKMRCRGGKPPAACIL
jgi:hypothetical protein